MAGLSRVTALAIFLICINLLISRFGLEMLQLDFVSNRSPMGVSAPLWLSVVAGVVGIVTILACYKHNLFKSWFAISFLIAGIISNLLESILFGSVRDYIPFGIADLNLADIEIVLGLLLINWEGFKKSS